MFRPVEQSEQAFSVWTFGDTRMFDVPKQRVKVEKRLDISICTRTLCPNEDSTGEAS